MKPASAQLEALLATRQFFVADLYTFSLVGGGVLNYCGGDRDITSAGTLYPCGGFTGPYFDRQDTKAKCHWKIGLDVDQLIFDVIPGDAQVFGVPFLTAVQRRVFAAAELTLQRAFMATYGDVSAGTVIMFVGRVAEIECGRSLATFTVNSHTELLNQNLPRNLYQPGCVNNLGDASCGVNLAAFSAAGAAAAGSTPGIVAATLAAATGYYDLGKIVFTGGALNGLSRGVKSWVAGSPGAVSLVSPFPQAPAAGDTFTIYAGCDKTLSTCQNKFNNLSRRRGFDFVPAPSAAT